ncbi:hypothetical protein T01_4708 [Trichinella spiralis]|uniref:Uncharacterized protein n=1 Tax=Trichinella spiralis TaxID=6334 RepID=A0A0V1AQ48_TRISP|nr:hypothetical protein T01_4708 [Trichinella spiralis]
MNLIVCGFALRYVGLRRSDSENQPFVVVDGVGSEFVRACDQVKCEYRRRSYDLNV